MVSEIGFSVLFWRFQENLHFIEPINLEVYRLIELLLVSKHESPRGYGYDIGLCSEAV